MFVVNAFKQVTDGLEKWPVYFETGYCWSWKVITFLRGRLLMAM